MKKTLLWATGLTLLSLIWLFGALAVVATYFPETDPGVIFIPFLVFLSIGSGLLFMPIRAGLRRLFGF